MLGQGRRPCRRPAPAVRAVTAADLADSPAAFVAVTCMEYDVEAARPVIVADVPVTAVTFVPSR